jgi:hypothetical protein
MYANATTVRSSPLVLFAGSRSLTSTSLPLCVPYLRALGARVRRGVTIFSQNVPLCTDLLTGDGTVIRQDTFSEVDHRAVAPTDCGTLRRAAYTVLQQRNVLFLYLPLAMGGMGMLFAALPRLNAFGSAPLPLTSWTFYRDALAASFSLFFGIVLVGLLIVVTVPCVLDLAIKPDKVYSLYGFHPIGPHNFLRNNIFYPSQGRTGDHCLLATKVMVPVEGKVRERVGLVGWRRGGGVLLFSVVYSVLVKRADAVFQALPPQYCSIYEPCFRWHKRYWKLFPRAAPVYG